MLDILSVNFLVFSPLAASLIIASPVFGTNNIYIRRFAKFFATVHFLYTLFFVYFYHFGVVSFYNEVTVFGKPWLAQSGINAAFGLDGLTLLLSVLTSFVFLIAFVISKTVIRTKHKMYYSLMFLLFTTVLGMFCAKDMFLFLMFFEAELVPLYFLISEWGTGDCKTSAMKYVLYNFTGSIFISIAMIGLYFYGYYSNGELTSFIDFLRLYPGEKVCPLILQKLMFLSFFAGFAVKLPIIPFHSWFTDAHSNAATPVSMILAAILTDTAAYGIIKFNLSLFPQVFVEYAPVIMIISALAMLYACLVVCKQTDIKKITAFTSIYFMGFFLIGLSSLNKAGIDGSMMLLVAHTLTAVGISLFTGYIIQSVKTKSLTDITGLGKTMPVLMSLSCFIIFSCMAVPFTVLFPAEFLVLTGAFSADFNSVFLPETAVIVAIFAVLIMTACLLNLFHGTFSKTDYTGKKYNDITGHRLIMLLIVCFCILIFGCRPDAIMNIYNDFTGSLLTILQV